MRARIASWRKRAQCCYRPASPGEPCCRTCQAQWRRAGCRNRQRGSRASEQTAGDASEKELAAGPRHSREMPGSGRRDPKRSARMSPRCPHPEPLLALPSSGKGGCQPFPPSLPSTKCRCTGHLDFSPHRCAHTRLHSEWIRLGKGFCSPARCRGSVETAFFAVLFLQRSVNQSINFIQLSVAQAWRAFIDSCHASSPCVQLFLCLLSGGLALAPGDPV